MSKTLVALLCFGKDSTRYIAEILDKLGIDYGIILPGEHPRFFPTHIILSGGPKHVYNEDHYKLPEWVMNFDGPVLGICYGMQIIAHTFGGLVIKMAEREQGPIEVTEIINGNQTTKFRWMNRYDEVISIPKRFHITGVTHKNSIASFTDNKKWFAVQYHPENKKYTDINIFTEFFKM